MQEHPIRDVYEEFQLSTGTVAMIQDPHNEYAWIQSNETMPVRQ